MLPAIVRAMPRARLANQVRTVISGPPTVKMSTAEKVAYGLVMTAGYCFVPTWVLIHIKDYRGHE